MKHILLLLFVIFFSCHKKESIKPKPKGCNCIQDTCKYTLEQLMNDEYPADSCKHIKIVDIESIME